MPWKSFVIVLAGCCAQTKPGFLKSMFKGDFEKVLDQYLFIAVNDQALFLEVLMNFMVPFI